MTFVRRSLVVSGFLLPLVLSVVSFVEFALGCTGLGEVSLPADLNSKLQTTVAAEDYHLAASIYEKQAQLAETAAIKYEDTGRKINPLEDPKNIRRSGLALASQHCRKEAAELKRLADSHRKKAETFEASRQAK